MNLPKTLEEYYQESGRAGRGSFSCVVTQTFQDGKPSSCVLFYAIEDHKAVSFLVTKDLEDEPGEKRELVVTAIKSLEKVYLAIVFYSHPRWLHTVWNRIVEG